MNAGLDAKPIVKGALREPGEITIVVIPLAKKISRILCAKGILGYIMFWNSSFRIKTQMKKQIYDSNSILLVKSNINLMLILKNKIYLHKY